MATNTMDKANSLMRAFRRLGFDGWAIGAVAVAALVATPLIAVVIIAVAPSGDIWSHLSSTVLPLYIEKTLFLLLGVGRPPLQFCWNLEYGLGSTGGGLLSLGQCSRTSGLLS